MSSEDELRALLAAITDVVMVFDSDGRCLRIAPTNADLLYVPQHDAIGRTLYDLMPAAEAEFCVSAIKSALRDHEPKTIEYPMCIGQKDLWFAATISPMSSDSVAYVAHDITERANASKVLEQRVDDRTRELTTLLDVAHNLGSTLELQPLLQVILEQVKTLAPYDRSLIMIREGDELRVLAMRAEPGYEMEPTQRTLRAPIANGGLIWELIERGEPVIIEDTRADTPLAIAWRRNNERVLEAALSRVGSWMAVPVRLGHLTIGMLVASKEPRNSFTARHAQLATAMGTHAAIAIRNAQLFEQTQQQARELAALLETSTMLSSTLELGPLMDQVLNHLKALVDCAGAAVLLLKDGRLMQLAVRRPPSIPTADIDTTIVTPVADLGLVWDEIAHGRAVNIDDVRGPSRLAAAYRSQFAVDLDRTPVAYVRAFAAVPLATRTGVIGMLAMARETPGDFDGREIDLAGGIAAQAAAAIENARLYEEAIQRTSELNTLLLADSELHRSLDLDAVLGALADVMVDTLRVDKCVISLRIQDSEQVSIRAARNLSDESIANINALYVSRLQRGDPVLVEDITAIEDTSQSPSDARGIFEVEGIRSTLDAPIFTPDGVVGGFGLGFTTPHVFTSNELRLAQAIAERAGVAIQNAQLVDEAAQRARETEALLQADAELFRSLNLDGVLQSLVDVAVDVLGVDKCLVTMWDRERGTATVRAARNFSSSGLELFRELLPSPGLGSLRDDVEPTVHPGLDAPNLPPAVRAIMEHEDVFAAMDVPIRSSAGEVLGGYGVAYTRVHDFGADERRLLTALADRAAVAIQNAELYQRAQQVASLEERQRLARELHDSVSQALYGIALGTRTARMRLGDDPHNAAEPLDYVASLSQAGLAEMRALIFELRPESLEEEGLVAAIEKQAASVAARYKLEVELDLGEEPACTLDTKEALYRITQEALHNVVKHAQARHVDIRLRLDTGSIELVVRDDGRGFDPAQSFPGHVGLQSMPERARKLGGMVTIDSGLGRGTVVTATLPL